MSLRISKELYQDMRRVITSLLASILFVFVMALPAAAQSWDFSDDNVSYTLEFPSSTWQLVSKPDGMQQRAEFVYGDRLDGYLQISKVIAEAGVTPSDLANNEREEKLSFKPGYVDGREEKFAGRLSGVTTSYEFTHAGKPMLGRLYYLQADARTIYVLHFTGHRDKLSRIRNQTDLIARSLKLKRV